MTVDEKITKTIDSCKNPLHVKSTVKLIDNTHDTMISKNLMTKEEATIWINKMKSRLLSKILSWDELL